MADLPVAMIVPPSVFLLDERVFMSLGILRVAAQLERAGRAVEMLDLSGVENFLEVAELHASNSAARLFALSTTTPQLPAAVQVARRLRAVRPDARLILGGPHVTLTHSAVKLEQRAGLAGRAHAALARLAEEFDVLVSGDGERAIFDALQPDAPPLIDADDPASGLFMSDRDYEESAPPARHLLDIGSYQYAIEGHPATSLIAQLGCPFGCGFCGGRSSRSLRTIRTRSAESIVGEMERLHRDHGYTGFMLYDDELNVNKGLTSLMHAIAALQERLGVEFRLRGFVKSELFTSEQAQAMHLAGFRWILCGFEAGSPRILENINKRATIDENTRTVDLAHEHGLKVKALMSAGHPGESEQTLTELRDWLVRVRPDDFDCTIITTYPGTPYYDEAVPHADRPGVWTYTCRRSGDRLHAFEVDFTAVAEYYKGAPDGGYRSYVFTDHLAPERLVELRDWIERDVRGAFGIPFNPSRAAQRYERSMGQGFTSLPSSILRASAPAMTARP